MRNKPTLVFFTFLFALCFTLTTSAQQQGKKKNNAFDLEIVKYSEKPNSVTEHIYELLLKNNSRQTSNFSLATKNRKCRHHEHDLNKAHGKHKNKNNNLNSQLFINNLSEKYNPKNTIALKSRESMKIYLKVKQSGKIEEGKWNCTVVTAKIGKDKHKNPKNAKSVTIESYSTNPNVPGH